MRLLIDTHAFVWFISGNPRLSSDARALIENASNETKLSLASLWEMAIKSSLGRLPLGKPFEDFIPEQLRSNGIELLNIHEEHVLLVSKLF